MKGTREYVRVRTYQPGTNEAAVVRVVLLLPSRVPLQRKVAVLRRRHQREAKCKDGSMRTRCAVSVMCAEIRSQKRVQENHRWIRDLQRCSYIFSCS